VHPGHQLTGAKEEEEEEERTDILYLGNEQIREKEICSNSARQVNYEGHIFTSLNSYLLLKHILQHDINSTSVHSSVRPWSLVSGE